MSNENEINPAKIDGKYPARTRNEIPFPWPDPALEIGLVHPQIPPNTGNISRLCAATNTLLHLVHPLGFSTEAPMLKRAGLDYWEHVRVTQHENLDAFRASIIGRRYWLLTTAATQNVYEVEFLPGDLFIFGSETTGLPSSWIETEPERTLGIPQVLDHVRCINLSSAAAVVLYEALRQCATRLVDPRV